MTIEFWGGPSDGYRCASSLIPPTCFFLPTPIPLMASVYEFKVVTPRGVLKYFFEGYQEMTQDEAIEIFEFPAEVEL